MTLPRLLLSCCLLLLPFAAPAQLIIGTLTGGAEIPPNASPGSGTVVIRFNDPIMTFDVQFAGLQGTTTMAHIHCCATGMNVGVATQLPNFATFPLGVTSGTHVQQLDLDQPSSWNSTFVASSGGTTTAAKVRLIDAIRQGQAYYNIHSSSFAGGEIRSVLAIESILVDGFE